MNIEYAHFMVQNTPVYILVLNATFIYMPFKIFLNQSWTLYTVPKANGIFNH